MDVHRYCPSTSSDRQSRIRPLTLVLLGILILAGIAATLVKLEQDRVIKAAFDELREMGFVPTVWGGSFRFFASRRPPSQSELRRLPRLLSDCARPHDLGFSPGLEIETLDLRGSGVSDETVDELKATFPRAEILK